MASPAVREGSEIRVASTPLQYSYRVDTGPMSQLHVTQTALPGTQGKVESISIQERCFGSSGVEVVVSFDKEVVQLEGVHGSCYGIPARFHFTVTDPTLLEWQEGDRKWIAVDVSMLGGEQKSAEETMAAIKQVFEKFDKNGDGKISVIELVTVFLELDPSWGKTTRLAASGQGDGLVTVDMDYLPEFVNGKRVLEPQGDNCYEVSNKELQASSPGLTLMKSANLEDYNFRFSAPWGLIVRGELKDGWLYMNTVIDDLIDFAQCARKIDHLMAMVDTDGTGDIDPEEFAAWLCSDKSLSLAPMLKQLT